MKERMEEFYRNRENMVGSAKKREVMPGEQLSESRNDHGDLRLKT
jgi:hypothetical protein